MLLRRILALGGSLALALAAWDAAPAFETSPSGPPAWTWGGPGVLDSTSLHRRARGAQAAFERRRVANLPMTWSGGFGTECDEVVGRMCIRLGRGSDWEPPPEVEEVVTARRELLSTLEEVAREIPGDDWLLGQRIRYLGEADRWNEAEVLARRCGGASPWWCDALLGYVLHHRERFPEAARAFQDALEAMDPGRAEEWRDVERLLDRDGYHLFRSLPGPDRRFFEERVWSLANPLLLVPGNDRRTAHFARHVVSRMRENARNPYNLRWGSDLAEITVRYGWEEGWERERPRWIHTGAPRVVGRSDSRSRGLLPPGEFLEEPAALPAGRWTADDRRTRARHAPVYSPRIYSLEPQVALFRRGDSVHVVAAWEVTGSRDFEGAEWELPPEGPYRSGLFLVPVLPRPNGRNDSSASIDAPWTVEEIREGKGVPGAAARTGDRGVLRLGAPGGEYVLSLETWHGEERKAWRARQGIRQDPLPAGAVALSSLLLTEPFPADSIRDLGEAVPLALPTTEVPQGGTVGVVWEVYGLGPGEGSLDFRLTVGREDSGLLRRAGEWLRLVEPDPPVVVAWSEGAPEGSGPLIRSVNLDLEALDPGEYELRLGLDLPGRTPTSTAGTLRVAGGPR